MLPSQRPATLLAMKAPTLVLVTSRIAINRTPPARAAASAVRRMRAPILACTLACPLLRTRLNGGASALDNIGAVQPLAVCFFHPALHDLLGRLFQSCGVVGAKLDMLDPRSIQPCAALLLEILFPDLPDPIGGVGAGVLVDHRPQILRQGIVTRLVHGKQEDGCAEATITYGRGCRIDQLRQFQRGRDFVGN